VPPATHGDAGVALPGGRARIVTVAGERVLCVPAGTEGFEGAVVEDGGERLRLVPLTAAAAERIRRLVPALAPQPLGSGRSSFGFGDRLGLATPGHVRALRTTGAGLAPVLAQQSARELERTGRTFRDVLDAATWGAVESGWVSGYGADADHLRSETEVADAVASGFTMLTVDPSAEVDAAAAMSGGHKLEERLHALPWEALEDDWPALRRRYPGASELEVARTAGTYGRALVCVVALHRAAGDAAATLDVEVSVDEINVPTSALAHRFLVTELRRLGVRLTGLAPRFPGAWRKGVDVAGDLDEIARAAALHARVAEDEGGHKVSVHSGSDKLAVYPLLASAGGRWHVKTSGTSYLEALRVVAATRPSLFRDVLTVARDVLAGDRLTYAIAETAGVPEPATLSDAGLPDLLDDADARQCLHVTYGSVITDDGLACRLRATLAAHAEAYAEALAAHLARHLDALEGLA
jgi:hypothetical protein